MSNAADETELPALPAEFRGLPYSVQREAFDSVEAELPAATVIATLGQATAETLWMNAAAHWLAINGYGERRATTADRAAGYWAGSSYGATVAGILAKLPRQTGRGRALPSAV